MSLRAAVRVLVLAVFLVAAVLVARGCPCAVVSFCDPCLPTTQHDEHDNRDEGDLVGGGDHVVSALGGRRTVWRAADCGR